MITDATINSVDTPKDFGTGDRAIVRRWRVELKLADKRELAWRKKAVHILKTYTPENPVLNSFNILWTNTETLRQAVYNSLPKPEVRRRYQDEDETGKYVSQVLQRSLEFCQESYDFDSLIKSDVLNMLLTGRSVSRVMYVPSLSEGEKPEGEEYGDDIDSDDGYTGIDWEQVVTQRVHWDDFRILCNARSWDEVNAIGFRHRLTRDECIEKFGKDIGSKIRLDSVEDEDVKKSNLDQDLFKTAEVWEIWDKDQKKVFFISSGYDLPCKIQDDPLELQGFWPCPRPLYAIEDASTLIPAALYTQYEQQALELNRVSNRINRLVNALKLRGVYDSTLQELEQLFRGEDNQMIAIQNGAAVLSQGRFDAAIWMMPIDTAAAVIKTLFEQREQCKRVIYEITGIADIMRSASDPNETFGAQRIKTQWGTQRLQKMQKEVQRYIRDIIRLKAEVISEKFQMETLEQMTLVELPHQYDVDAANAQAMVQYQMQVQAGQQAQPPKQENPVTWESVVETMRNDAARTFRIDIETDSTLSASQDSDMENIKNLLTGVTQFIQGVGPAVQAGAIPIEAVREIILSVVRRAKMGSVVEEALGKIRAPDPAQDNGAAAAAAAEQAKAQLEQQKMQQTMQIEQARIEMQERSNKLEAMLDMQVETHKQEVQAQQVARQNELQSQSDALRADYDARLEALRIASDERMQKLEHQNQLFITQMNNATKIDVAEISAHAKMSGDINKLEQKGGISADL